MSTTTLPVSSSSASADHYPSASLYVGDLAPEVNEALLFEIFNAVGPVASIRVCRDATTRKSLGYAYVNFHNVADAERALDTMNFSTISSRPCRIMWSQRDPSLRKSGVGNIFVKNLAKSIDHKTLYDTFSVFGNILSCKVATNPATGESLGYGFVHFETDESAKKAIDNAHGMLISGISVVVAPFRPKSERESSMSVFTNLYVKGLPEEFTDEKLTEMFSKFGPITSAVLSFDATGKFRGFGFVNFENPDDAAAAVTALNESLIGEKKLYVGRAMKKSERSKILKEKYEKLKSEEQKKFAGCNLYIKNLPDTVDDEKLREEFVRFGEITSAKVMTEVNGRSRGFGFVCYVAPESASKAVAEMNGKIMDKKMLFVGLAQRKEVRRAELEAQWSQRSKLALPPMYPAGPGQVFYSAPAVPSRPGFMFAGPGMVPPRRWGGAPTGPVVGRPMGSGYPSSGRGRGRPPRGRGYKYPARGGREVGMPAPGLVGGPAAAPLTLTALASASPDDQKQMLGEKLFPMIREHEPRRAGKITGMLLEMENTDLLDLLESPEALRDKIAEAVSVLEQHERAASSGTGSS